MLTLTTIELTCPNCGFQFTSPTTNGDEASTRRHTDFYATALGPSPIRYGVHLCERCGFAGPDTWFTDRDELSFAVRGHVWNELTPRLSAEQLPTSEKYEFAAKVAGWNGVSDRDIADIWLRAAWCCVDEGDTEAECYYRRHAVHCYESCLASFDAVPQQERAVLTYLVGELWRRIGNIARAQQWFDRVPREIRDRKTQGWIARWAKRQSEQPTEWFA